LSVAVETVTLASAVPEMTEVPDEISLEPGEETSVSLESRAGQGYTWTAEADDEAVADAAVQFEPADETGRFREKLIVRGRAEGTTRVRLVQRRTWEEGVEPQAAHTLTVNVAGPAEATERGGT
jgi:predicted secreted protein